MSGGVNWAFGVRFLYDQQLRFFRPGGPCSLRMQNFTTPPSGSELGFDYTPPDGPLQPEQTGFTDIKVQPPVEVFEGGTGSGGGEDLGVQQAQAMFYKRKFFISHTFVKKRMNVMGYTDPYQVWRDPIVIGLFYSNRLHRIETIDFFQISGETIAWNLGTTYQEQAVTVEGTP